ncbi:hypothetical protein EX895_005425 [Sporisorium graminicola]|uniref:Uncharacterized protein n=1 Tax=Sporisorium graminicola TaxID=280036 RepID=A0A4U7KNN1_9BASI|nr:hypothetical protein EX895_005425 [Sporisorium graminicola]TKY85884.1 hypothetical protein EX895_005425 [Sporisorium graminicola]
MTTNLLSLFHIFGALVLWMSAVIHLLVHPLSVPSSTITIVLISLGSVLLVQEFSTSSSRWYPSRLSRPQLLSSCLGRALCLLVSTAVTFDQLTDLPCDVQVGSSPYSTSAAKFSVSSGDAARNVTTAGKLSKQKGPPEFGTAFYICRSLAPQCVPINTVPGQNTGSTAWVNVSVNSTSQVMVLSVCALTLAVSATYFVLALLHRSDRTSAPASMGRGRLRGQDDDPVSLRFVEVRAARGDLKPSGSDSSACRVNFYANGRGCRCKPVDLYAEQLDEPATRCPSVDISLRAASPPSLCQLRGLPTSHTIESMLIPSQGAASMPDHVFRIDKLETSPLSTRAASDIAPRVTKDVMSLEDLEEAQAFAAARRDRYGYEGGYDRTVDFASGCIMHYPLFTKKKREQRLAVPSETFSTLLPPDFSRGSLGSATGLTPRKTGKSRASVASRTTECQPLQSRVGDGQEADCGPRAVTTKCAMQLSESTLPPWEAKDDKTHSIVISTSAPALLSPSALDPPDTWSTHKKTPRRTKHARKPSLTVGDQTARRLGTAESARSFLSTMSNPISRPSTATSTKSANSFRLMRRRRGLFATLDLQLGSRFNGTSQDASVTAGRGGGGSYDSQRSCSAGTFGDGVAGDVSPLSTPKGFTGASSSAPWSPSHLALPPQSATAKPCMQ